MHIAIQIFLVLVNTLKSEYFVSQNKECGKINQFI